MRTPTSSSDLLVARAMPALVSAEGCCGDATILPPSSAPSDGTRPLLLLLAAPAVTERLSGAT
jgi:hypothetical protein